MRLLQLLYKPNLGDSSKSIDANISGLGVFTPTPDGGVVIKAEANWLFWFFPGDFGSGSPGVILLRAGSRISLSTEAGR
jgi:hypothetical protein